MSPREELTRLALKHQLEHVHNPGGGAYLAPNGDRCQVHGQQDAAADLEQLRAWLIQTGREPDPAPLDLTLTETLERLGYSHNPAPSVATTGHHQIRNRDGRVVFTGRADEVWAWLRRGGAR